MSSELRSPKFATLCKKWRPLSHNMMLQTVSTRSWNRRSAHAYAQYEKWPCSDADFPVSLVLVPKGNASPKIRNLGDRTNFFFRCRPVPSNHKTNNLCPRRSLHWRRHNSSTLNTAVLCCLTISLCLLGLQLNSL